jgi:hypothetical protein
MNHADQLRSIAQSLVDEWPNFFAIQGAGAGDRATNVFMRELRRRAATAFGRDFAEQRISGSNKLAVDFYFPDDATIVEVAMSLRNPSSEFERDILKAIMAQESGSAVTRLLFLAKPGAVVRCAQPGVRAFADWRSAHMATRLLTAGAGRSSCPPAHGRCAREILRHKRRTRAFDHQLKV